MFSCLLHLGPIVLSFTWHCRRALRLWRSLPTQKWLTRRYFWAIRLQYSYMHYELTNRHFQVKVQISFSLTLYGIAFFFLFAFINKYGGWMLSPESTFFRIWCFLLELLILMFVHPGGPAKNPIILARGGLDIDPSLLLLTDWVYQNCLIFNLKIVFHWQKYVFSFHMFSWDLKIIDWIFLGALMVI